MEYRGTFQGSLAAGLRGSWFVNTSRYTGEGAFHLWPALWEVSPSAPTVIAVAIPIASAVAVAPPPQASAPPAQDVASAMPQASAPTLEEVQANMVMPIGEVFVVDTECVVCFDAAVGTCLRPCGHVCMCTACTQKVGATCPICRAGIESVEHYQAPGTTTNPVTGGAGEKTFVSARKFEGVREGYYYTMAGPNGAGYYRRL